MSPQEILNISVIVPVLDEGARIERFLQHLRERASTAELIVVTAAGAGSITQSLIASCDQALTAPRGRASQMNAGAAVAGGDVLWFVHADCEAPEGCLAEISRTLDDPRTVGGCFRIRFPGRRLIYRVSDAGGNLAVELFGRCYGDHGIFCRHADFFAIGGFPDVPLLEDAEFYRQLRRRGRTRQLSSKIVASPRRYEEIGPYRLTASYLLLSTLYLLRVPIPSLARIYNQLCLCQNEPPRAKRSPTLE
jgi:rSAM/selenodomain-associated transferase 2